MIKSSRNMLLWWWSDWVENIHQVYEEQHIQIHINKTWIYVQYKRYGVFVVDGLLKSHWLFIHKLLLLSLCFHYFPFEHFLLENPICFDFLHSYDSWKRNCVLNTIKAHFSLEIFDFGLFQTHTNDCHRLRSLLLGEVKVLRVMSPSEALNWTLAPDVKTQAFPVLVTKTLFTDHC